MLIPKKNRQAIYTYLFNEGVICAKKDFNAPKHHAIDVPNLYVIKALQSLKSKGFVTEKFSWQWYYWYLTNEGTNRLREYLHLAEEVVPATLKATKKSAESRGDGGYRGERYDREGGGYRGGGRGRGSYDRGDREGYRGSGGYGDDKKSTPPPGDFVPSFREGGDRGGRGRGFGGRGGYDREGGGYRGGDRGDRGEGGYRGGDRGEGGGYRGDGGYRGGDREGGGFGRGRGRGDTQGGGEYRRSEGGYRGGGGGGGEGGFSRGRGGPPRG